MELRMHRSILLRGEEEKVPLPTKCVSSDGLPVGTITIDVIVPCYNAQATLGETLESVLTQPQSLQVIAVDDGSNDNTLEIARGFEPRVRVLTGPNQGASAARNKGIAAASAEWLLFLDADDVLMPGTIALRLETARAAGADVVICDWQDIEDDGSGTIAIGARHSINWPELQADAERATATDVWAPPAAILYRRSLVEKIGGFRGDLPIIQDARFLFDAAYNRARFAHSPHVGAQYRVVAGSLSRRSPGRFWEDVLLNGQQIERLWQASGTWDEARRTALFGVYNHAARGLFRAAHSRYFEAIEALRGLDMPMPRHGRIATPVANLAGLRTARSLLSLVERL
jgi:glycosyltransferase involved in cell wall biosynthesis